MLGRIMSKFFTRGASVQPILKDRDAANDLIRKNDRPPRTYHGEDIVIRQIEDEYRQARQRLESLVLNAER